jgi:DNA end-binding protein Ku
MAAIWKGALTFGLVNIPVELRTAVRGDHISFRMLREEDMSAIKYERVAETDGEPVPWDEIVKGYEYEKGKFVVVTDEDFKTAALEASKTIDILNFVSEEEIDPRYFDTPYFLVPAKGAEKSYALLREAIRKTGTVGIGKVIIRQKQHLAGIKVVDDAMVLEIMRFQNELVESDELTFPDSKLVRPQELQMAEQLVNNLAEPFDPSKYRDEYRDNLMRVIKAKVKGKSPKLKAPAREPAESGVLDLMSKLRASLDQGSTKSVKAQAKRKGAAAGEKSSTRTRKRKTA